MTTGRINQVCRCHPELQQSSASATPLGDITTIINQSPDTAKQAGQVMRMQHCCREQTPSRLPSLSYLMRRHQAGPSTTWWKTPSSAKHRAHNLTPKAFGDSGAETSSPKAWMKHEMLFHLRCQYSASINIHLQCCRSTTTLRFLAQQTATGSTKSKKQKRLKPKPTEKTEQPEACNSASCWGHQKTSLAPLNI